MIKKEVLTVDELAIILGTSSAAIRMSVSRGQEGDSIPPSIKLGSKRRWPRKGVYEWLDQKAIAHYPKKPRNSRGRPRPQVTSKLRNGLNLKKPRGS